MAAEVRHYVEVVAVGLAVVVPVLASLVATGHFQTAVGPAVRRLCSELGCNGPQTDEAAFAPVESLAGLHKRAPVRGMDKAQKELVVVPDYRGKAVVVASTGPFAAAPVSFQVLGIRRFREAPRGIVGPADLGTAARTAPSTFVRDP